MDKLTTIDFNAVYINAGEVAKWTLTKGDLVSFALNTLQQHCHAASYNRGWWHDPITGLSLLPGGVSWEMAIDDYPLEPDLAAFVKSVFPYVIATKIALIHSETSEALEAYRTGAMDDKIPFPGVVAEGADSIIRWLDLIECLRQYEASLTRGEVPAVLEAYNLANAMMAKLPVNVGRADHDFNKRNWLDNPGAKKF